MGRWNIRRKQNMSPFQVIILGFLLVILLGSFLLMLPVATQNRHPTPFIDALFTSTSAVCVTVWSSMTQRHIGPSLDSLLSLC